MANLRLKKTILEVVENQLKDNNPLAANEAYRKLLDAGYSTGEAKEKIGTVVLTEIYDALKENQPYDEKRYGIALEEMVQQSIDFEDTHSITTEWEEWDELVERGYEAMRAQNQEALLENWWRAWEIFQRIAGREKEKYSVSELMEEQDYQYPVDEWLQDFEMELGNSGEHEKRLEYCHTVLDMLDWTFDDGSNFRSGIGKELYAAGKTEEGEAWFRNWLKREPHNEDAWSAFSWCVQEQEGAEAAYRLIRKKVIGVPCTIYNSLLFERAKLLAEHLERKEDLKWIESQLKAFDDSMGEAEFYDGFYMPVQKPIVKEKKIYPNEPCPCGSGKKYKKCCGKG